MGQRQSVLVISRWFPPEVSVGGDRPAGLAKHLARSGWRVTVVSARPAPDAAVDPGRLVPADVEVLRPASPDLPRLANGLLFWRVPEERRKCSSRDRAEAEQMGPGESSAFRRIIDWLSFWLQLPDGCTGWLPPAVRAGIGAARRHRPDVVFSTGPVWTAHLVGLVLSRLLRRPWVADFRDPWCGSQFQYLPYPAHRRCDEALEALVIRNATKITCAWDGICKHLMARYPHKACDMHTVLNGFDPEEIDASEPQRLDADRCVLLHAGTFYGPRSPVPLLRALRLFEEMHPAKAKRLLVVFMGLQEYLGRPLGEIVAQHGVTDLVRLAAAETHKVSLSRLKGADVALLFGQSGSESLASVPAKAYEYIGTGKPVLAIGAGTEALEVMRRGGCKVWAAKDSDPQGIASALKEIAENYVQGRLTVADNATARLAFSRSRMAEQLTLALESACRKPA